jgi:hypothetical protein
MYVYITNVATCFDPTGPSSGNTLYACQYFFSRKVVIIIVFCVLSYICFAEASLCLLVKPLT